MAKKKIILFIVEGITDRTTLGLAMSKVLNNNTVEFKIIGGDITADVASQPDNMRKSKRI